MPVELRRATPADLGPLVELESAGFDSVDRFSRQHLRYLLTQANATTLVIEEDGRIVGSSIILWRKNSFTGRLYSIVVHPDARGRGLGARLLDASEEDAVKHGCTRMHLEVRPENAAAISLYKGHGYRPAGRIPRFYDDGHPALRMVKDLQPQPSGLRMTMPYYPQTMDFTCGPASLMMAMKYLNPRMVLSKSLEMMLWKEATLIFMTEGLGGCGPFGLAWAALKRGFHVSVVLSDRRTPFLSSVRSAEKKEVITVVHEALRKEARRLGVVEQYRNFSFRDIAKAVRDGAVPVVLISTYRLHRVKAPHWVVVTGFDDDYVYFHDPYEGFYEEDKRKAQHFPIPIGEFQRMHRYGKDVQKSLIIVSKGPSPADVA